MDFGEDTSGGSEAGESFGPGLAVRCLGEVTREKLAVLREAEKLVAMKPDVISRPRARDSKSQHPTSTISDRMASRYEPVVANTTAKTCGPIHDVPRSLIS